MTWYGVDAQRFNPNGTAYAAVGELETRDHGKAWRAATEWAGAHPDAASLILRDGDPYAWVHSTHDPGNGETTVEIKDCVYGHTKKIVNGHTVHDSGAECWVPADEPEWWVEQ